MSQRYGLRLPWFSRFPLIFNRQNRPFWLPTSLFLFLSACYLLVYTGNYYSIDEMGMFNMTESLLRGQGFSVDQLNWIEVAPTASIGSYGVDGRLYTKVAQTQSLVALPFVWIGSKVANLGQIKMAFLVNVFLTAANGVLVYAIGRILEYDDYSSLFAALAYGLATPAFPYSKTFFSEPLSGFCLLASLLSLAVFVRSGGLVWTAVAGGLLGISAATRLANLLIVSFFAFYLVLSLPAGRQALEAGLVGVKARRLRGWRNSAPALVHGIFFEVWRPILLLILPVLLTVGLLALYNANRFAAATEAGYAQWDSFSGNIWTGLYALLVSPGKGLFLYVPLFAVLPFMLPRFLRRCREEGLVIVLATGAYILVLSRWLGYSGGWAWGPRLLMPLVPIWALLLLPLPRAVAGARRWKVIMVILLPLSVGVQILGAVVDYAEWLRSLPDDLENLATVFDPRYAAHLGHIEMIRAGRLDLAWLSRHGLSPVTGVDWSALWPLVLYFLISFVALILAVAQAQRASIIRAKVAFAPIVTVAALCLPLVTIASVRRYTIYRTLNYQDVQHVTDALAANGRSGDGIISAAITASQSFQNLYAGPLPLYGMRNDQLSKYPTETSARLASFVEGRQRIWLLLEWTPPGTKESGLEIWLAERGYRGPEWEFEALRLILFDVRPAVQPVALDALLSNEIRLEGILESSTRLSTGESFRLALIWSAVGPIPRDYTSFVHLEDEVGHLVAQIDRQPWAGLRPTSTWRVGEQVVDRHALLLEKGLAPGRYWLYAGMYTWPSLERLLVVGANRTVEGDRVRLGSLDVGQPR